ncbi:MAG TPA: FxsB family cyclophane-forming radical SAM/SPASM peptide maturase [Micromonosporaceae bacterium]|nr:FxsB family cyclophane-forming radical SAM/SPASM peptide maturase [Micromonosporaceae bacterium]
MTYHIAHEGTTTEAIDDADLWSGNTLNVPALRATGWRPAPIREFILKLVGRCNLACRYCYVYTAPDRSWLRRPQLMSAPTLAAASRRIGQHAAEHGLRRVRVVLHGGEPLLAGAAGIELAATAVRRHVPAGVELDLRVQTNGVLLDETVLRTLHKHRIRVGVSLDGDADSHDRHRVRANGRGSYAETVRGLRLLCRPEHRDLFAGLLCVVDAGTDPLAVYEELLAYAPPSVDLLLPHGNWSSPPPGRTADPTSTPYADWLITVFDRWYATSPRQTRVVIFEEVMNLLLGGHSRCEQVGLSPVAFLVIDTDGTLQQVDTLKSAFPGAPDTGLDVFAHRIDAALDHPSVAARQIGLAALGATCRGCRIVRVCGGGHYTHRYRHGHGFRQPSVYCADLTALIGHIRRRLHSDLRRVAS